MRWVFQNKQPKFLTPLFCTRNEGLSSYTSGFLCYQAASIHSFHCFKIPESIWVARAMQLPLWVWWFWGFLACPLWCILGRVICWWCFPVFGCALVCSSWVLLQKMPLRPSSSSLLMVWQVGFLLKICLCQRLCNRLLCPSCLGSWTRQRFLKPRTLHLQPGVPFLRKFLWEGCFGAAVVYLPWAKETSTVSFVFPIPSTTETS